MKNKTFLIFCLCFTFLMAHAAVPSRIVYQGRLSKSGVGAAGRHTITVQFVDAAGTNLSQSQTFDVDVPTSGDFSLEIDHIPPDADWINGLPKMRVIVGGETLTPDQAFSAAPYALVARNVENLTTDKVKLAGTNFTIDSWQSPTDKSKISSSVIAGTVAYIVPDNISPSKIQGNAVVLNSTGTQILQPTDNFVPLTLKGHPGASVNLFEVWDFFSTPEKRFYIKASGDAYFSGNVGIGIENPIQKLRVEGNDKLSLFGSQTGDHHYGTVLALETTGNGSQSGPRIGFQKTNAKNWAMGIQSTAGNNNFSIWEDGGSESQGGERFTIAPGGNVGIGTPTGSGQKLRIDGGDQTGLWITQLGVPTNGGLVGALITRGDGSQSGPRLGFLKDPVKAWVMGIPPGLGKTNFSIWENCFGADCTGSGLFSIASGGNVGIGGEPSTVAKLKVVGTDTNPAAYIMGATNQLTIAPRGSSVDISATNVAQTSNVPLSMKGSSIAIKTDSGQPLTVTDGKVGVNTTTPTKALDVVGDANITGQITGATFGFGGMYTTTSGGGGAENVYKFKNPITNDYSCPAGFTSNRILYARTGQDAYDAWLVICTK